MAVYDMDSHLRDEYFLDEIYALDGEFAEFTPKRVGDGTLHFAHFEHKLNPWGEDAAKNFNHERVYNPNANWRGGDVARAQVGGYDMERRIADNRREGIDFQLVFPTQISLPTLPEGPLGSALCRNYNDWVANLVRGHEETLWPVAMAPAGHPEGMADELRRCVEELGFKAGHLVPYSMTRTIDDEAFYPYYEAAERLDVPLLLHPASFGELVNRFDNFFAMHVLGRPFNCTAGLIALVIGGIFERFPGLRVGFFECSAEWILYWMHRMDDDYDNMRHGFAPKIDRKPSDYVRRNCYVTCEADERLLPLALEEFEETRVMMASDYPHFDSEYPGTVAELRARSDITDRQKDLILTENAKEFLRL